MQIFNMFAWFINFVVGSVEETCLCVCCADLWLQCGSISVVLFKYRECLCARLTSSSETQKSKQNEREEQTQKYWWERERPEQGLAEEEPDSFCYHDAGVEPTASRSAGHDPCETNTALGQTTREEEKDRAQ